MYCCFRRCAAASSGEMGNGGEHELKECVPGLEKRTGEVLSVIFHNEENGFTVLRVIDTAGREFTARGFFPSLSAGQNVELYGVWETSSDYGVQFAVREFRYVLPTTREGVERFLGSGLIPGVGPKLARSIVDYFGDRTIEILNTRPGRLREIEKIGAKKADLIRRGWQEQVVNQEQLIFLQGLGLTPALCRKLLSRYGGQAGQVVRSNPYKLADEVSGIGFLKADKIAQELGIAKDSPVRQLAGLVYAVNNITQSGHSCYPLEGLLDEASALLGVTDRDQLRRSLEMALRTHQLVLSGGMVYPEKLYAAERELPKHVRRILSAERYAAMRMKGVSGGADVSLTAAQLSAVDMVSESPLSIITGGPGVGKTTVLGELVRRARAAGLEIQLAAPTGRAAKRLGEATGVNAKTVHRLLMYDPSAGGFIHDALNPLDCDLLIVDEVSMLDLPLALALFQAVKSGTALVLVGDVDQLPSVGPGTVLLSLINSGVVPVTRLTEVFRQGGGSMIIRNAHLVNEGRLPELTNAESGELSDFYWIETDSPERALKLLEKVVLERIPERFGLSPRHDIEILTPTNRGMLGTVALNIAMQSRLNGGAGPGCEQSGYVLKRGDKVMQTVNNYDKGVYNGDLGEIVFLDESRRRLDVEFEGISGVVSYDFGEASELSLAYAITVHKSQGAEFPAVVLPLMTQHYMMLQRNLLYTAMTRARKLLVLIGDRKAVRMAVENYRQEPRYGNLESALKGECVGVWEKRVKSSDNR